jgi:hypothetical protein
MNNKSEPEIPRFVLKDCALIALAGHKYVDTLKESCSHFDNLNPDSRVDRIELS